MGGCSTVETTFATAPSDGSSRPGAPRHRSDAAPDSSAADPPRNETPGPGGVLSHGTPKWINGWFPKYLVEKYGEKWMKYMKSPSDKMGSVHEIHPKLGKFSGFQWHISAEM